LKVSCFKVEIVETANVGELFGNETLHVLVSDIAPNKSLDSVGGLLHLDRLSIPLSILVESASLAWPPVVLVDPFDERITSCSVLKEPASCCDILVDESEENKVKSSLRPTEITLVCDKDLHKPCKPAASHLCALGHCRDQQFLKKIEIWSQSIVIMIFQASYNRLPK
jgi:hypothetical protein